LQISDLSSNPELIQQLRRHIKPKPILYPDLPKHLNYSDHQAAKAARKLKKARQWAHQRMSEVRNNCWDEWKVREKRLQAGEARTTKYRNLRPTLSTGVQHQEVQGATQGQQQGSNTGAQPPHYDKKKLEAAAEEGLDFCFSSSDDLHSGQGSENGEEKEGASVAVLGQRRLEQLLLSDEIVVDRGEAAAQEQYEAKFATMLGTEVEWVTDDEYDITAAKSDKNSDEDSDWDWLLWRDNVQEEYEASLKQPHVANLLPVECDYKQEHAKAAGSRMQHEPQQQKKDQEFVTHLQQLKQQKQHANFKGTPALLAAQDQELAKIVKAEKTEMAKILLAAKQLGAPIR